MRLLAIESTCDETAAAVVEHYGEGVKVVNNVVASSALIHQKYGGVVPEVAAREQIKSIIPVLSEALNEVDLKTIEAVAVSYGPGLMGSLLVGVETAKVLAEVWNKPLIKVNHMEAHVAANWIKDSENTKVPALPAIGLIVSGGHTDLILMKTIRDWEWIGGTRDDAVGEAFDKAARLLGLPYPGGPSIQKAIDKLSDNERGKFVLPRPMIDTNDLSMSFSGLKAALAKVVSQNVLTEIETCQLAKEFNEAVVDVLVKKTLSAQDIYHAQTILVAGGVAANKRLRERFSNEVNKDNLFIPELRFCGDNAAMVGAMALLKSDETVPESLSPNPSLLSV